MGGGDFGVLERRKCVWEHVHLAPLSPGKWVTKLLISSCVCVWEAMERGRHVRKCGRVRWGGSHDACRTVLFGSLQGAVASFPLWVDPGTVSGTEVHQKPQQFDYKLNSLRSKPHSAF